MLKFEWRRSCEWRSYFCGTTEAGRPNYVDDGNLIPSAFQLKPGQTLGGFSFRSPYGPNQINFVAQPFKLLPTVPADDSVEPDFFDDSFLAPSVGPVFPSGSFQNPIDEPWYFVHRQYRDFLNREPDATGISYWAGQITQCNNNAQCVHDRRVSTADAFFFENEFQDSASFVYRTYRTGLGFNPTFAQFLADRNQVVAGSDLSKTTFASAFVQRSAFLALFPRSQSAAQFVDLLLSRVNQNSNVDLTSLRGSLISLYDGTDSGRAAILKRVADNHVT